MFLVRLLPLLSLVAADKWTDLKTTFGLNPFGDAFQSRARTIAEAIAAGWQSMDACNGNFNGHRYGDPNDPSLVLIFDDAGYIAGMQTGLLLEDVDENMYPFAERPVYNLGDFFGRPAYFTTAYFTDPAIICAGGRTEDQFYTQGTGDRLLIQTGPTADSVLSIPLTQAEADMSDIWYDHFCFLGMGDHYFQFDHDPNQDCKDTFPVQILYDQGVINGFVWQHAANLPGSKWEHPDRTVIDAIIDRPPTCIYEAIEYPGLSTMHTYFYSYPWLTICPFKNSPRSLTAYRKFMMARKH